MPPFIYFVRREATIYTETKDWSFFLRYENKAFRKVFGLHKE